MRRLVIEVEAAEFARLSGDKSIGKVKSLKVIHFIKQEKEELAFIANVEFKNPRTKLEEIFEELGSELQVLDRSKNGKYMILFKSKPQNDPQAQAFWAMGGYLLAPLEIRNEKLRFTFMGNTKQVKVILMMLKKAGVKYKTLQTTSADFPSSSPLSHLTEKQRRVLTQAYNLGYYDIPRKIDSGKLAARLNIGSSDLIKHRRKAERRLIGAVLQDS